jgi:hypothetical protein
MITSSTNLLYRKTVEKLDLFLIDVVVPRKVHEVHDLLVIAKDTSKPHLVT